MRSGTLALCCGCLLLIALGVPGCGRNTPARPPQVPSGANGRGVLPGHSTAPSIPAHLAVIEISNGLNRRLDRVLHDGRRFRSEQLHERTRAVVAVELHDGADPDLVLRYIPRARRGGPTPAACIRRFWGKVVPELGEEEARRRYAVTGDGLRPARLGPSAPDPALLPFVPEAGMTARKTGVASHCGRTCEVWAQHRSVQRADRQRVDTSIVSWVDRASGLVLRRETKISFGENSPAPPRRITLRTVSVQFNPRYTDADFEVPRGATIWLPETFAGARLPPGVRRVMKPGMGIPL